MSALPLVIAPDPRLKRKAEPVETVDAACAQLAADMLETMYESNGIGLAATQVGISRRVIVVDTTRDDVPGGPYKMINPEVLWSSDEREVYEEGCLSLPEQYAEVERPSRIQVRYLDPEGVEQELEAEGLLATCIQHEIDHLDGILFVDHLSALKRRMILRKLEKLRKQKDLAAA